MSMQGLLLPLALQVSPPKPAEYSDLMDRIESVMPMPSGARALESYERFYARETNGEVAFVFVILPPNGEQPASPFGCLTQGRNIASEGFACAPPVLTPVHRYWVSEAQLPKVSDGGCDIVEGVYSVAAGRVIRIRCNGIA